MKTVAKRASPSTQVAALPVRACADGTIEVLMVTSRDTGRWIIPKGWPMPGKKDWDAAAIEAMEEAGVTGAIDPNVLGTYTYFKRQVRHFDLIEVAVYRLDVERQLSDWRERKQRRVRWLKPSVAAALVQEPGLSSILIGLGAVARK